MKNAWGKLNKSLELMSKITKNRTVVRINLVKNLNMVEPENYAKLIQKANPMFIEVKGYIAVGYARQRLGYDRMPWHKDILNFSKKILKELKKLNPKTKYKIIGEHELSKVVILGKSKKDLKIKKKEI